MTSQTPGDPRPTGTPVFDQTSHDTETAPPVAAGPPAATTPMESASGSSEQGGGKKEAARDEAKSVASDARGAGERVAGSARDAAGSVASEAKSQTRELYHETTAQLREQAGQQQQRVASGLRDVGGQLNSMADSAEQDGVAADLVRQAGGHAETVAGWLDERDPGALLQEVKRFAARKPGTFIAMAAGAGILAGRLTKSLTAEAKSENEPSSAGTTPTAGTAPVPSTSATAPAQAPVPPATETYRSGGGAL